MSSLTHQELAPGQFRPGRVFVTVSFILISALASFVFAQQLLARQHDTQRFSAIGGAGVNAVEAAPLPERNLLGTLFVAGAPEVVPVVAPKRVAAPVEPILAADVAPISAAVEAQAQPASTPAPPAEAGVVAVEPAT